MKVIQRALRRIDEAQQRHVLTAFVFGVLKKYGDDNAGNLSVQIAYSLFVTVFPLLLLLITILGIVLADNPSARHRVLDSAFAQFPVIGQQLSHNIHAMKRSSTFGLIVGIIGLVYGSTGLAQAGLYSMEEIWNIPGAQRPNYLTRIVRSLLFLVVLAVGLIISTTLAGFGTFGRHNIALGAIGELPAMLANFGLYLAGFRVLTPKHAPTRHLIPGAIFGGIVWTVLQAAGGYVVGHDLKGASATYGIFGFVLGLVAWIYLGANMTVYAAELNTVLARHLWPRAMIQPPLTEADQRSLASQVTENQRRSEEEIRVRFQERPMDEEDYRSRNYKTDQSTRGVERTVSDS